MTIFVAIVTTLGAFASGFFAGRIFEMEYGIYKTAYFKMLAHYEKAIDGWKESLALHKRVQEADKIISPYFQKKP